MFLFSEVRSLLFTRNLMVKWRIVVDLILSLSLSPPQAGVKGKLGRLLGVFEVRLFSPSWLDRFNSWMDVSGDDVITVPHTEIVYFSTTAEPGPETPDVRVCADGHRDAGCLGGLCQYWWVCVCVCAVFVMDLPGIRPLGSTDHLVSSAVLYFMFHFHFLNWIAFNYFILFSIFNF